MIEERNVCWFKVEQGTGVAVLTFLRADLGEEEDARLVGGQMLSLLGGQGGPQYVLDFGRVRRLCSAMLGKLVAFNRKVKQAGGEVTLRALSAELVEKFRSTRLDRLFPIIGETGT